MNIEIIGFYPIQDNKAKYKIMGTLHIYLIDYGLDIRGIFAAVAKNGSVFFKLPCGFGVDQETGQKVRYPILGFTDQEKERDLIKELREKSKKFIEEKLSKAKP